MLIQILAEFLHPEKSIDTGPTNQVERFVTLN